MTKRRLHDGDGTSAIGARLRTYRVSARVTQESLANAAKLTPKFLSQIENGHVNPSIGVLTRLVEDGLHLPLAAFFTDDGDGDDDDSRDTLVRLTTLLAAQPPKVRRLALRIVEVLCASDDDDGGKDGKSRHR